MRTEKIHIDDLIYDTKKFIFNLSRIQDQYFKDLVERLDLTDMGEEWLFDYVFNHSKDETFEEYIVRHNRTMDEMVN